MRCRSEKWKTITNFFDNCAGMGLHLLLLKDSIVGKCFKNGLITDSA